MNAGVGVDEYDDDNVEAARTLIFRYILLSNYKCFTFLLIQNKGST
jgi:hypothetical protein